MAGPRARGLSAVRLLRPAEEAAGLFRTVPPQGQDQNTITPPLRATRKGAGFLGKKSCFGSENSGDGIGADFISLSFAQAFSYSAP